MRVFVAGATGVIGQFLVPGLVAAGHEVTDAATATVAAVTRGALGLYNVVDDEPATVAEWAPFLASSLGAKPPMRASAWLGRLLGGELAAVWMTQGRGSSNAKARRELGWTPNYPSWRDGFPAWVRDFHAEQESKQAA